jgi:hypothetical protein
MIITVACTGMGGVRSSVAGRMLPHDRAGVCQVNGSGALSVVALCAGVSRPVMIDAAGLAGTVLSGLSALVIEDVEDAGEVIRVWAVSTGGEVPCPGCGAGTGHVHGYHERTAADVPAGGRRVVVTARLRRLRCPVPGCRVQTFREQVRAPLSAISGGLPGWRCSSRQWPVN